MHTRLKAYLRFAQQYPQLFQNPTPEGITILLNPSEITLAETEIAAQLLAKGYPPTWAEVGIVQEDQYALIIRDAVRFPDGRLGTYRRQVNHPLRNVPGVAILPIWQEKILLIQQFRHALRRWTWEIPRGMGELDCTAEENVKRELQEEIGATDIIKLIHLGDYEWNSAISEDCDHLYLAQIRSYGEPEHAEGISAIKAVSISEFETMLAQKQLRDGYTLAAYALAKTQQLLP